MPIYAGIDIGTLTLRLLIAKIDQHSKLEELAAERRIVRLGQGLQASGRLQAAAMSRVIDLLREWVPIIQHAGAQRVRAVATSAVREAANRGEFLDEVKRSTGLEVEVLSGAEEARLALLGIQLGLPPGIERFLALDIGGGSTEFIKVSPKESQTPVSSRPQAVTISIDEGVVRLTDDLLKSDPPSPVEVEAARSRIRAHLKTVGDQLGSLEGYQLIGTAGTVTTLAAMDQGLEVYSPPRIHNYRLLRRAIERLWGELLPRTHAERRSLAGLEAGREDVILAGTLILLEVMERFGFSECLVSDYGLREGVLIDLWRKTAQQ
jgi:exopolyphosphatase/guanosine-5'-triphosphate,3'-diphosphate pyrophosphatase